MDESVVKERIAQLKADYASGQEQLRLLEGRQRELQNTMMRISGAIQVLEEVLSDLEKGES